MRCRNTVRTRAPDFTDSRLSPPDDLSQYAGLGGATYRTAEGFILHDVGTLKPTSGKRLNDSLHGLDTPTLKGIWETAPYLHDGSAPTLMDVITTANPGDRHGRTSHLSAQEKQNLVEYLMQLDDGSEPLGLREKPATRFASPAVAVNIGPDGSLLISLQGFPSPSEVRLTLQDVAGHTLGDISGSGSWSSGSSGIRGTEGPFFRVKPGQGGMPRLSPGIYIVTARCPGKAARARFIRG